VADEPRHDGPPPARRDNHRRERDRRTVGRLPTPHVPVLVKRLFKQAGVPVYEIGHYWSAERRSIRVGSSALGLSLLATLLAGAVLLAGRDDLTAHPGLLMLVPAAIGMRGSLFGALAARLGTGIFTGQYEPDIRRRSYLGKQVEAVALLTMSTATMAGLLAWVLASALGLSVISLFHLVAVSVVAGLLASVFLLLVTLQIAKTSHRRGWSMDDVGAPLITAAGDLITLPMLLLATLLLPINWLATVIGVVGLLGGVATAIIGWQHNADEIRRICRESLVVLGLAVTLQVLAGIVLESREESLVDALPALLGLVPPFAAMCGSLGGLLSSRLSSKLHLGLIEPRLLPGKLAGLDVSLTFLLALVAFTGTGAIGWVGALLVGVAPPNPLVLISVALLGGAMATVALSLVAYASAAASLHFGFDPDNHGIPIVTAVMDFLGILCLVSAVAIIGVG
jgi:mgtE-like transporter